MDERIPLAVADPYHKPPSIHSNTCKLSSDSNLNASRYIMESIRPIDTESGSLTTGYALRGHPEGLIGVESSSCLA